VDYNGADMEIGFNAQYLLDFLGSVTADKVRMELKDENSASVMRPEAGDDIRCLYVLMPMKI
jgi:DNA polymerase-3 subunit beta